MTTSIFSRMDIPWDFDRLSSYRKHLIRGNDDASTLFWNHETWSEFMGCGGPEVEEKPELVSKLRLLSPLMIERLKKRFGIVYKESITGTCQDDIEIKATAEYSDYEMEFYLTLRHGRFDTLVGLVAEELVEELYEC